MPTTLPSDNQGAADALRCEACGYPISGIAAEKACPECGEAVSASLPGRRDGPAWERSMSVGGWLATGWAVVFDPRATFRRLRVDGSALRARLYLLTIVVAWLANPLVVRGVEWFEPATLTLGLILAKAVLLLTYFEAGGLTLIGRQRGWRLPFAHAERVACYAATGWLLGLALAWLLGLGWVWMSTTIHGGAVVWVPGLGHVDPGPTGWLILGVAAYALIALPFETLAYLGSRQCKFANRAASPTPRVDRL